MDIAQYATMAAVIVGVTELISRARAKDWWVVATIITSAAVGGLFGYFAYYPELDVPTGIALGFAASGALKTVSMLGNKSEPQKSKVLG